MLLAAYELWLCLSGFDTSCTGIADWPIDECSYVGDWHHFQWLNFDHVWHSINTNILPVVLSHCIFWIVLTIRVKHWASVGGCMYSCVWQCSNHYCVHFIATDMKNSSFAPFALTVNISVYFKSQELILTFDFEVQMNCYISFGLMAILFDKYCVSLDFEMLQCCLSLSG